MFGIILALFAALFLEVSCDIGKKEICNKRESIYTMGFLSLFWSLIWFALIILYKRSFVFSLASLPTFLPRAVLEVALACISYKAISQADRSTYGFLRILTIPLLLVTDLWLNYTIALGQFIGIFLITGTLLIALLKKGVNKKGAFWVLLSAIGAVFTITLYKYDITNFNSVEAEQFLILLILMICFFFSSLKAEKRNPFKLIFRRPFALQSLASGTASVIGSFAYVFDSASIIATAERSAAILWSVSAGRFYFHEKNLVFKVMISVLLIAGIILLLSF